MSANTVHDWWYIISQEKKMLNLNKLFTDFNDKISLTKTYKNKIKTGRDALRGKIDNKFEEKNRKKTSILHSRLICNEDSYYACWRRRI